MTEINSLADAFQVLLNKPEPPPVLGALTYSELKFFDRAISIYSSLPESASEVRQTFHCTKASAVKVYTALVSYFEAKARKSQ